MSAIIWYMFSSDWLISLSIVFSMFLHAVAKGNIFFLFLRPNTIALCKCTIVILSTHLLMDTWCSSWYSNELSVHKPAKQDFQEVNGSINCQSHKDLAKT